MNISWQLVLVFCVAVAALVICAIVLHASPVVVALLGIVTTLAGLLTPSPRP